MSRSTRRFIIFILSVAFSLSSTIAYGQAVSGDITGIVTDQTGAAVPAASVTGTNEATGVKTTATVNSEGSYRLPNLPVGSYTIAAVAKGFSNATLRGVSVSLSSVVTANLTLELGSTATTVEVSSAGAVIDTTTAQLQTTFEAQQIQTLPSAALSGGAGIWNLSLIGAGVTSQGGVGQGTGPSISGQRPENNSFTLDGVNNNDTFNTGPLVYTSNESVAEISLLQNQFSPEFGGGSGGIFNAVVKSGGNAVHGSIYEYFQNRNLNAVDANAVVSGYRSNPRFDNNRLGATIGGPIIKDKLFYFGNFEYDPYSYTNLSGTPLVAPTAAGYSLLNSIPGLSKTNLSQLQTYLPAAATSNGTSATVSGVGIPLGSVSFPNTLHQTSYDAVIAIDYNLSQKDQIRGRYIYNKQDKTLAAQDPVFSVPYPNTNQFGSVSEFHNFSPLLQNEFRASFSRNVNSAPGATQSFPGLGGVFPVITIDELNSLTIGPPGPTGSIQNLAQFQDNMVAVLGKHTLKFGYHFTDVIITNYFIQRLTGNYEYNSLQQYLQDLTPDVLGERSVSPTGSYPVGFLQNEAFFNDDIRLTPHFTVNLGVRYEYVSEPVVSRYQAASAVASVPGVFQIGKPSFSPNDWSPRLGFAYSPGTSGAWSIRGGFARSFDLVYGNLSANAAPPYFQQTADADLTSNAPNFLARGGLSGTPSPLPTTQAAALGPVSSYTFSNKRPYGLDWNLGVQHVFHKDYTFETRYVGTRGVHLWNQTRLNIYPKVNPANYIPTYFTLPSAATLASLTKTLQQVKTYIVPGGTAAYPTNDLAVYGSQSNIVGYAPQGTSTYNGWQNTLTKRFSNNLSFIAAYTWSHVLDDATATNFSTYLSPRRAQDFQNLKSEWASSALDHRHRFTFTPIYDFQPFKNGNWFLRNLVGNWNISGTYTYETPEYATVQSGIDSNLNGDSAGDRTIVNPSGQFSVGSGVTGYNAAGRAVAAGSSSIVAYVANNPNARFVVAGQGALANSGRNNFPLAPTNNIDLALSKKFNFNERVQFSIGAQAYNVLNHSQFTGGYTSDVGTNSYTTARNDLVASDPLFGNFSQFYSSNSRRMQLTAHFTF